MQKKDTKAVAIDYFDSGYKHHLAGKIPEAIEAYLISIQLFPTAKAHTFLGWAYSLQGRFEEAIDQCYIAIELDPDFGNPYNDIGSYLISLGRLDEAIGWLEQAINALDYDPRYYPYYNLGMIYEKKGDWFTAMEYYYDALKINPDYDSAKTAVIRLTTLLN